MVSDKTIHKAFRIHTTLFKQNPLEIFFLFSLFSKLYIGFISCGNKR